MRILIIFLLNTYWCWAQLNNTVFNPITQQDSVYNKRLIWKIKGFSYIKNNEYFNEIIKGQTFFGQQFTPEINWKIRKNWQLNGGVFFIKNFGSNEKYQVIPTYSIQFQKNNFKYIFGTLEGDVQHLLIEPLYNFERILSKNRIEEGMQVKFKNKKFYSDIWINWLLKEQNNTSTRNEKIEGGAVLHTQLVKLNKFVTKLISNSFMYHQGGQNYASPFSTYSTFHQSVGLKFSYEFNSESFVKSISTENHFIFYNTQSDSLGFKNGNAQYYNFITQTKWGDIVVSYWLGNNFINPAGGDLFSGVSRWSNYKENNRELLLIRWMKNFDLNDNLHFTIRIEPYYDLNKKQFEHSATLALNYLISR